MQVVAVTNDKLPVNKLGEVMAEIDPFVDFFIIRERTKKVKEWLDLINIVTENQVNRDKLIVNDRIDVALISNIQRVQLPGHSFHVQQVKSRFPHLLVGCSIHNKEEAAKAAMNGADWLLYGHIFTTECKRDVPPRGFVELKEIVKESKIDVFAIGGILPDDAPALQKTGVKGIATMSTVFESNCPGETAEAFSNAFRTDKNILLKG